jgi:hypothetical protein
MFIKRQITLEYSGQKRVQQYIKPIQKCGMEDMDNELSHFLNYLYENKISFSYIICVFFTYNVRIEIHLYNTFLFLK